MPTNIADFDWSRTPLGPKSAWSAALKTTYDIMMGTEFATCATWGPEKTLIYNAAYIPFLGARHPDALGQPIQKVWHDVWDEIGPLIDRAMAGERVYMEDLHLIMTRNGFPEDTYWTFSYSPLKDGDEVMGMLDIAMETTSRVAAERRQAVLVQETTHRLKNTLALVQAVARQSLRGLENKSVVKGFEERLQTLATAHDILLQREWESADIQTLISSTLQKLAAPVAYELQGPQLAVSPRVAQSLSLVMHELATNAIKHGALSVPEGRIVVRWWIDDVRVGLEWQEQGGPPAAPPAREGFGSRLIMMGLTGAGGTEMRYQPEGFVARFTAPVESLLEH